MEYTFTSDYKNTPEKRESFFALARRTFGLDFTPWYNKGGWGPCYSPQSFALGGQIVANVSVNHMQFLYDGITRNAIQLGTVMVDEAHRGKGLAGQLMRRVLQEYSSSGYPVYLYADASMTDFYGKFGFSAVQETLHSCLGGIPEKIEETPTTRLLNHNSVVDSSLFERVSSFGNPASRLSMQNNPGLLKFHCMGAYKNSIYLFPAFEAAAITMVENNIFTLLDLYSKRNLPLCPLLLSLAPSGYEIHLGFTPTQEEAVHFIASPIVNPSNTLFVLGGHLPVGTRLPMLAQA